MNRGLMIAPLVAVVLMGAAPVAQTASNAERAAAIERECGLKEGTIAVSGDHVRLRPAPDEAYEKVDCAVEHLNKAGLGRLGFVGNEAKPKAALASPLRYIAVGSKAQIAALTRAARIGGWVIVRTATASDGTAIVQLEGRAPMTNGQAERLLNRIWKGDFGDISFGFAPRKLSSRNPVDY